jgi:hypothetical protein
MNQALLGNKQTAPDIILKESALPQGTLSVAVKLPTKTAAPKCQRSQPYRP